MLVYYSARQTSGVLVRVVRFHLLLTALNLKTSILHKMKGLASFRSVKRHIYIMDMAFIALLKLT